MTSKSDQRPLTPEQFKIAMSPIYRVCREESGATEESRREVAAAYYAILKNVDPRFLRSAVVRYLASATEPWFPMPAVLLGLARQAKGEWRRWQRETAPDCPYCVRSGLVDARQRGATKWECFDCFCIHSAPQSTRRFDPESMETLRSHNQSRIAHHGPVKRLLSPEAFADHFSIPEPSQKTAAKQREELAQVTAGARRSESKRLRSAEIELLKHAEARAAERMAEKIEV